MFPQTSNCAIIAFDELCTVHYFPITLSRLSTYAFALLTGSRLVFKMYHYTPIPTLDWEHFETKMSAHNTKCSIPTILRTVNSLAFDKLWRGLAHWRSIQIQKCTCLSLSCPAESALLRKNLIRSACLSFSFSAWENEQKGLEVNYK